VANQDPIDVVLPAHNEGDGIGQVLREFHEVNAAKGISVRFVVCEDGSTDNTVEVINSLAEELPIELLTAPERKGYSRAVVDGLRATTAGIVGFVDSDGQCDPEDLEHLLSLAPSNDLVVGYRVPRRDAFYRRVMSRSFKFVYERLFPVRLPDPSCPFMVIHQTALDQTLRGNPGLLRQGFWWEFYARANAAGLRITTVPIRHRERLAGETQVYRPTKIPGIAVEHIRALFTLRRELEQLTGSVPRQRT
jgi:glycosyltransferase involved in cell wall biosynthesis